ncbi:unnamed protein product, partial [marine sediment metagenome]
MRNLRIINPVIDISENTNLAVAHPITLTDDTIGFIPGSANYDMLQWNSSTGLWEPKTTLSGLTLVSPVISGDFSWIGEVAWDCSDNDKIIDIGSKDFSFRDVANGNDWIKIKAGGANNIRFGNDTDNPAFLFLGTGIATFGGNLDVTGNITTGQYIGDTTDPELIEIDGAGGVVTVDGDLDVIDRFTVLGGGSAGGFEIDAVTGNMAFGAAPVTSTRFRLSAIPLLTEDYKMMDGSALFTVDTVPNLSATGMFYSLFGLGSQPLDTLCLFTGKITIPSSYTGSTIAEVCGF